MVNGSVDQLKFSSTQRTPAAKSFAMRTCVIFNPAAKGDKARRFRRHLDQIGAAAELRQTSGVGDAWRLAREAVDSGFQIVVAAGGDGTVNEVLNGIGDAADGFERAALGVLPLGTVNVFARELKIPRQPMAAWEVIRGGHALAIDLPWAEFQESPVERVSTESVSQVSHARNEGPHQDHGSGKSVRRYFAQLAGSGLDARAIELVHWPLKKKIGPLAYVVAGLRALLQPQSRITVSDGATRVEGELVLIGNGRLYGGEFAIFPKADLRDGELEVSVFPKVNWMTLVRCGPSLLLRRCLPPRATINLCARSFSMSSPTAAALELDGELAGHLPARFGVERNRLRVVMPAH